MRLTSFPLVLAGASLLAQHAAASPVRVLVVSSHQEVSTNGRGPVAAVIENHRNAIHTSNVTVHHPPHMVYPNAGRHCGGSLREKAMRLSNKLFGFPELAPVPIEYAHPHVEGHSEDHPDRVSILPFLGLPAAISTEDAPVPATTLHQAEVAPPEMGTVRIVHMNGEDGRRMRFRHHRGPFLRRLHFALMALGPWEGRAVAFVLGCGIGVLLRMIWVLGVVLVRAVSYGRQSEEHDNVETIFVMASDAEEILVPPPQYTDEKVAYIVDDKPAL
ncbi:hypothetical protein IEO21_05315 [Rhodonia placenta]|uniref:Protein BIG1 n=1 Tax=Rhodonia placenta TaxID=104341 RepID=A0A8H7P2H0_9APHY|nr:hypothetical protein IEO21_05315 [Postia placenta]